MKWFLAKIIFRIIVTDETRSQFDIQLRLIQAVTPDDAFHKAKEIGFDEEEIFPSTNRKKVEWKFIDVESVYELSELKSGTLLCTNTQEEQSPEAFISEVKNKSSHLQEMFKNKFATA